MISGGKIVAEAIKSVTTTPKTQASEPKLPSLQALAVRQQSQLKQPLSSSPKPPASKTTTRSRDRDGELLVLELDNPQRSLLQIRRLSDFDPTVKPGERLNPASLGLAPVVFEEPFLNMEGTAKLDDPRTPDVHEGIAAIWSFLEKDYLPKNKELLKRLGISDPKQLSPKEAVLLTSAITMERLEYSRKQISEGGVSSSNEREVNDETPIDRLLQWEIDPDGNGVCRNYARVMHGVFEALKAGQSPGTSRLNTSHVVTLTDPAFGVGVPGTVSNHAWNGVLTFTPEAIEGSVLDSTWADSKSQGSDPAQAGISSTKLDYTDERFFTLVQRFETANALSSQLLLKQLAAIHSALGPVRPERITRENVDELVRKIPLRIQIGERMVQILTGGGKTAAEIERILPVFLRGYAEDLQSYLQSLRQTPAIVTSQGMDRFFRYPLLEKLKGAARLLKTVEPPEQQEALRERFSEVLRKFETTLVASSSGFYYRDMPKHLLEAAEQLGDRRFAEHVIRTHFMLRSGQRAVADNVEYLKAVYEDLSPERQAQYRELFKRDVVFPSPKEKTPLKQRAEALGRELGLRVNIGYGFEQESEQAKRDALERLVEVVRAEPSLLRRGIRLSVEPERDVKGYSVNEIAVFPGMSATEIKERVATTARLCRRFEEIQARCPAKLEMGIFGVEISAEQVDRFLDNLKSYVTEPKRAHLLRYRELTLTSRDNTDDYLQVYLDARHFLDGFSPVKLDDLLSESSVEEVMRKQQKLDLKKRYQELERAPEVDGIRIEDEEVAAELYESLAAYLDGLKGERQRGLGKHPVGITILDYDSRLYDSGKEKLIAEGFPYYLVRALSTEGLRKVAAGGLLGSDGHVLRDGASLDMLFPAAVDYGTRVLRGGEELPLIVRGHGLMVKQADGQLSRVLRKGDRLVCDPDPTAHLEDEGNSIAVYPGARKEELHRALDKAVDLHLAYVEQAQRLRSRNFELRVRYFKRDRVDNEELASLKRFVKEIDDQAYNAWHLDSAQLEVTNTWFDLKAKSASFPIEYSLDGAHTVEELGTFFSELAKVEKKAGELRAKGISFSPSTKIGCVAHDWQGTESPITMQREVDALDRLLKLAETGKYKGYQIKLSYHDLVPPSANAQVYEGGKIVVEPATGEIKLSFK